MSEMVRAFVGLPLPREYKDGLERLRKQWQPRLRSKMNWTRPGNWHLTLKFLGDVEQATVPDVAAALNGIDWRPFTLRAGGGGFFPPPKAGRQQRPRVAWVGLKEGAAEVRSLARAVEAALVPLGFAPEDRPFSPHLTIARIKQAADDPWNDLLAGLEGVPWPGAAMAEFVLWKSVLGPGGPKYSALGRMPART